MKKLHRQLIHHMCRVHAHLVDGAFVKGKKPGGVRLALVRWSLDVLYILEEKMFRYWE